jgi:hypothetical protein
VVIVLDIVFSPCCEMGLSTLSLKVVSAKVGAAYAGTSCHPRPARMASTAS